MAEWYEDYNNWLKLLPIAGGVGSTLIGNNYLGNAAGITQNAANLASSRFNTYANAGNQAVTDYANMLKQGPGNYQDYMNTPYYQFPYEQGIKALERGAAARGNQLGGRQQKALVKYGQDYAGSKYDEWMNNWYKSLSAYNPLMATGYGAVGQQASYDALGGMAQASAQIGQGQNWSDLINAIGKFGGDLSTLNELKKLLAQYQAGTIPPVGTPPPTETPPPTGTPPPVGGYDNPLGGDVISSTTEGAGGLYGADSLYGIGGAPTLTAGADAFSGLYGADALYGIGGGAPAGAAALEGAFSGLYGADAVYGIGGASAGVGAGTGTGVGATLAAAAPFALAAAVAAGFMWGLNKSQSSTHPETYNPFIGEYGPALIATTRSVYQQVPDENMLTFYRDRLPTAEEFGARYQAETGTPPPTQSVLMKDQAEKYHAWMDRQPEVQAARIEYQQWLDANYRWNDMCGAGGQGFYERIDPNATPYVDNVTYGAEGAVIDEPMVAVWMKTGKKLVMGEAGKELLMPVSKMEFNKNKKSNRVFDIDTMSWVRR